jgi:hypothetical protein
MTRYFSGPTLPDLAVFSDLLTSSVPIHTNLFLCGSKQLRIAYIAHISYSSVVEDSLFVSTIIEHDVNFVSKSMVE